MKEEELQFEPTLLSALCAGAAQHIPSLCDAMATNNEKQGRRGLRCSALKSVYRRNEDSCSTLSTARDRRVTMRSPALSGQIYH